MHTSSFDSDHQLKTHRIGSDTRALTYDAASRITNTADTKNFRKKYLSIGLLLCGIYGLFCRLNLSATATMTELPAEPMKAKSVLRSERHQFWQFVRRS